ncbi:YdeI/OmpD-associated family protein [Enterococcus faecalis]|uniref:YdeI/OmpD-associated family protein n=1 Tax=Enterococcus faecalis TaxID=1351 RepID=UPI0020231E50|nr:YdeI/OmpD-associated family protein [Enterococcus faecalis]MCL8365928.1 YdeI/OmpD-associated family protein [Enterococcus faecalis]MCU7642839.1 YdeI/OmpD-associated family protein [Enterococcus faecalis]
MKSIVEKLNLTKYQQLVILNRPQGEYLSEFASGAQQLPSEPVELIFAFVKTMAEFQEIVSMVIEGQHLVENGLLYVAYPKKGNKMYPTFVHRDEIFPTLQVNEADGYIKGSTLKFNRMVSLDETFTVVGMKNVLKKPAKNQTSSAVGDYVQYLPEIEALVQTEPAAAATFAALTPGYQKEWARYVFSAKRAETRKKRQTEMLVILKEGYKTKALYQQRKK